MPTKEGEAVIEVVREDREMWEAAKLQSDCNLANLVFLALLTFGSCFQYSSKYKQACREMLIPCHIRAVRVKCLST